MSDLVVSNRQSKAGPAPEMGRITLATATFGVSRSGIYRMAAQHPGLLVKLGAATLVDFRKLREILASLPEAKISTGRAA